MPVGDVMTEAEWLAVSIPRPLLDFLGKRASERKLRLYGVACCRKHWDELLATRIRTAVETAERLADKNCSVLEQDSVREAVQAAHRQWVTQENYELAAHAWNARACLGNTRSITRHYATTQGSCEALRDIFGNPFRPVKLYPSWLTSTVVALARGIYDERAFDRMPILASVLQDAGCNNAEVLNHCRDEKQMHFRGCWVVDMLLGKT